MGYFGLPLRTNWNVLFLDTSKRVQRLARCGCFPCNPNELPIFLELFPEEWRTLDRDRHAAAAIDLFDPDPRVLDHLASAHLLAAKISLELFGRARDHDQALVLAQSLESLGLNRRGGGFVEAGDDVGRRLGRREQAIPAL